MSLERDCIAGQNVTYYTEVLNHQRMNIRWGLCIMYIMYNVYRPDVYECETLGRYRYRAQQLRLTVTHDLPEQVGVQLINVGSNNLVAQASSSLVIIGNIQRRFIYGSKNIKKELLVY